MNLGILGTGKIVQEFLPEIEKLKIEYKAILSSQRSKERAENLAAKYKIDKIYFDYDELLTDEKIDTIYIALPNNLHYQFAKKALLADKNVIVEKPAVTTAEELADLKKIATERKKILIEAVTLHYMPAYKNIRADLPKLGNIKIVSLNYSQYSSRYDAFKRGEILPAFDPKKAGGALMDLNCYNVNFVVGLFGAPKSFSYSANIERGIDTSGVMVLDYGNFKAVCIGAKDCEVLAASTIQGDMGNIFLEIPANRIDAYIINYNNGDGSVQSFDEDKHRMIYEFENFIDIIDGKDFARAEKMLNVSEIVAQILQGGLSQVGIKF
jgi:predicted dehydrogenase